MPDDAVAQGEVTSDVIEQETDANTTSPTPTQGTADWDSDDNPHKRRAQDLERQFNGLRGNFQQLNAERQELVKSQNTLAEELAGLRAQYEGRTPEEIESAKSSIRAQARLIAERQAIVNKEQQLAEMAQQQEAIARVLAIEDLARRYGVDKADLEDSSSFKDAERIAKILSKSTRKATLDNRRESKVDAVEGGGSGGTSWNNLTSMEKIRRGVEAEIRKSRS